MVNMDIMDVKKEIELALKEKRARKLKKLLLKYGHQDMLIQTMYGKDTPLCVAIRCNWTSIVRKLLDKGVDHAVNGIGYYREIKTIVVATENGNVDILKLLVARGADLHIVYHDFYGPTTLLGLAVEKGHTEAVRYLLENGVDPNKEAHENRGGLTPLALAIEKGHVEIVRILLEHGANPNKKCIFRNYTPIQYLHSILSCRSLKPIGHLVKMLTLLVKSGGNINAKDEHGFTLLHNLIIDNKCCFDKLINKAIRLGADVNAKNNANLTPLYYVCDNMNNFYLLDRLVRAGADVNIKDARGNSLLIRLLNANRYSSLSDSDDYIMNDYFLQRFVYRSYKKDMEIVARSLIEKGAYISRKPIADYSQTVADRLPDDVLGVIESYMEEDPLDVAIENRHDGVVKLIATKRGKAL